ncbi:MAG: dihydrodipicolinate synthase family protein [Candidatus Rokubacteria bacterium]|nr:dihydrodipicolinate synthase family protein [Candidatus Rokubacteria bacterium]
MTSDKDEGWPPGEPIRVRVEILSWVNRFAGGPGTGEVTLTEEAKPGTTVRAVLRQVTDRYPPLAQALWDPGRSREIGDNIEVLVNNTVLGVSHDLDSELTDGDRITLLGQYMGGAMELIRGIVAAPVTPMTTDFEVDWPGLRAYLGWLVPQRPTALALNMDAGEGPSLSPDERLRVIEEARDAVAGACPVWSGLIAGSTREATAHGRALAKAGAQGLVVFPPVPAFMGEPLPWPMPYEYHRAVGDATGLPLVLFQFPRGIGPSYSNETLCRLAEIPQVVAMKESTFDAPRLVETLAALRAAPKPLAVLTGSDTFLCEAYVLGAHGALIGFGGIALAEQVKMFEVVQQHDYATAFAIWGRLGPLARMMWGPPLRDYRPRMKEALVMLGVLRSAAVRPPMLPIGDAERRTIRRLLVEADLLGA